MTENPIKKRGPEMDGRLNRLQSVLLNNAIYIIMFAMIVVIVCIDPSFLKMSTFNTILAQSSTRIIFALGVAGVIVLGGTDLSLGRTVGIAAVASAVMLQAPDYVRRVFPNMPVLPLFVPIVLVMLLCAGFSSFQGVLVAKVGIAPFIASLSMQLILYGINAIFYNTVCSSNPISGLDVRFSHFAQGFIRIGENGKVSFILFYALICAVIVWFIWNKTVLGKNMFAIGGNSEAAKVSGVNVARSMILVYMITGLLYGFGGALEGARTGSAVVSLGQGYEMDAIAACVVGGVSMRGGTGNVWGVVIGVIIFQIVNYGLIYIGINPDYQFVAKGVIILMAVTIDTMKFRVRTN